MVVSMCWMLKVKWNFIVSYIYTLIIIPWYLQEPNTINPKTESQVGRKESLKMLVLETVNQS
jgi:hypothetical protein